MRAKLFLIPTKYMHVCNFLSAGTKFVPGESSVHAWNAVFLCGSWWLVDCTWGAGHPPEGTEGHQWEKEAEVRRRYFVKSEHLHNTLA